MKLLLTLPQTLFIFIVPTLCVIGGIIIFCFVRKAKNQKSNYKVEYYKTIRNIADAQDYYLINNFIFKAEGSKTAVVDHLLVGNKYFYVITSMYYDGNLSGKENDTSLFLTTKEKGKTYTDNPLYTTKLLLQKLNDKTGINLSLMIGIVLVNDSCQINLIDEKRLDGSEIPQEEKIYFLLNNSRLKNLIKKIENRNVKTINATQLDRAIKGLDKLNRRKQSG